MELTSTLGQITPINPALSLSANIAKGLARFEANPFLRGRRPTECRLHPLDLQNISESEGIQTDLLLVISHLTIPGHIYICAADAPTPKLEVVA